MRLERMRAAKVSAGKIERFRTADADDRNRAVTRRRRNGGYRVGAICQRFWLFWVHDNAAFGLDAFGLRAYVRALR